MNLQSVRFGKSAVIGLTVAIGAVLTGGFAIASAARHHTVTACVSKGTHVLRLASHGKCSAGKKLSWNVRGPRGKQGPTGPSAVYAARRDSGPSDLTTSSQTVATLSALPAGAYLIQASTEVTGSASSTATDVLCRLAAGTDTTSGDAYVGTVSGGTYVTTIPLTVTHTFSATGTATLSCNKDLASSAALTHTRITAVRVGSQVTSNVTG
jgi:hypothetical protein